MFFRPPKFYSNADYFQAVQDVVAELNRTGHRTAAAQVEQGFRCLNGLTDGRGLLLESIEGALTELPSTVDPACRERLVDIRDGAYDAIHRRW